MGQKPIVAPVLVEIARLAPRFLFRAADYERQALNEEKVGRIASGRRNLGADVRRHLADANRIERRDECAFSMPRRKAPSRV